MPPAGSTTGAQKKFHEIHWVFNVVTAVLVFKDGNLDVYESESGFLKCLPDARGSKAAWRYDLRATLGN
ncbi:hypothetical protein N0V88_008176 [Collariella sp. IMI 366227]|nr:hypothetical protein N0V88_008176 [Collariella sp. IMI 366227]